MQVKDYMTTGVITANLRDGLYQTWERMKEHNIRHMPVYGDGEQLAGIISDRDIRRPEFTDRPNFVRDFRVDNSTKVEEAMTAAPVTVHPDSPLAEAASIMLDRRYGALPVTRGEEVVGIISQLDVLRAFVALTAEKSAE